MDFSGLRTNLRQNLTVLDGGLATALEARGHDLSGALWSARLLHDEPEEITEVHKNFVRAGARILTTASYQVSRSGFSANGLTEAETDAAIVHSVEIARAVANAHTNATGEPVLVAGSMGAYGATLADGSEYRGDYQISESELTEFHRERLQVMVQAEPDLLAFETIPSASEVRVINHLLSTEYTQTPAWISCSAGSSASIADGTPTQTILGSINADCVVAFGFNCIAPELATPLLQSIVAQRPELPRIVYTNSGRTWDALNRMWLDEGTDCIPTQTLAEWRQLGACIIGGCCGLGETHIHNIAQMAHTAE